MIDQPVAVVTGGSRGIGRAICVRLAREGYAVVVNYAKHREAAEATRAEIGDEVPCLLIAADIAERDDRNHLVDEVLSNWGRIDVLVNNAGITSPGRKDILEADEQSWERVFGVNLKGPFFLTQRVAQEMICQIEHLHNPTVVNVSSLSAFALSTNRGDYCISKAGIGMMTQLFAARLAPFGIRVFEIRPGVIETDMTATNRRRYDELFASGWTPISRWGRPEDVAAAVAILVGGELSYSTGDVIHVDGGYHVRRFEV